MYQRNEHAITRQAELHQLVRDNALGQLTTAIVADGLPLIQSTHVPWMLETGEGNGKLLGHMAKANPQVKAMLKSVEGTTPETPGVYPLDQEVLVVFTSNVQHYVTPKFYTETKPTSGKVVPTWNYATVHARGKATLYVGGGPAGGASTNAAADAFLQYQIDLLSKYGEKDIMGYTGEDGKAAPWKVSDAPTPYLDIMRKMIVGIAIEITDLEGKYKMSQEMREGDRAGVVAGFASLKSDTAAAMSAKVAQKNEETKAAKAAKAAA